MKKFLKIITLLIVALSATVYPGSYQPARCSATDKQIVGWIENVVILPKNIQIKAKLDTGARHSSLNAVNMVEFKRQGQSFVRFDLTNWHGQTETIEAKVSRTTKIRQHNSAPEPRPVIRLGVCLGKVYKETEVNLVDRSNFNYQLLIGRSFLKGDFAVDPAKTFTLKANCREVRRDE